jgi:hypothetical protein
MAARAPKTLSDARVLRYRGDVGADWSFERYRPDRSFQGEVIAVAIIEDEPSGGVLTLFLHADGTVGDEWHESLEDALAAIKETTELDQLAWADTSRD